MPFGFSESHGLLPLCTCSWVFQSSGNSGFWLDVFREVQPCRNTNSSVCITQSYPLGFATVDCIMFPTICLPLWFFVLFWDRVSLCNPELPIKTRLALKLQRSACLSLLAALFQADQQMLGPNPLWFVLNDTYPVSAWKPQGQYDVDDAAMVSTSFSKTSNFSYLRKSRY